MLYHTVIVFAHPVIVSIQVHISLPFVLARYVSDVSSLIPYLLASLALVAKLWLEVYSALYWSKLGGQKFRGHCYYRCS